MILKIFSERVKKLRKSNKITLSQLGDEIGFAKSTLSDIENGRGHISFEFAFKVSDYFNTSLDYLTGRSDNPQINK